MINEHAPWSLSKSDLAAKCPYAFKLRYLDKLARKEGPEAKIGVTAHRAEELILMGTNAEEALETALLEGNNLTTKEIETVKTLFPALTAFFDRMVRFKEKHGVVQEFTEQQWAIDRNFKAVDWNDPTAFFRGVVDYAMLTGTDYLVVVDHKSGRRRPVDYYARQLDAYAVLGLAHMPNVKGVHAALHYMKTQDLDWHMMRRKNEIEGVLRSSLMELLQRRADNLGNYSPTPNNLCGWCDYLHGCSTGTEFLAAAELLKKAKAKAKRAEKRASQD